jgi:YHS domain-containing protein
VLRVILLILLFLFVARAVWRLLEGVMRGVGGYTASPQNRPPAAPTVKMAQCPVCHTYVVPGKAISGVSKGQAVYFCSEACRKMFAA